MEEGPEVLSPGGVSGPLGRRLERVTALVPLLLTGVRHHPPGRAYRLTYRQELRPGLPGFP